MERIRAIMETQSQADEERHFGEFRRKVRAAEVLSAALHRLLQTIHFTGRLSIIVKNGRVLKSGYEEGYFQPQPTETASRLD
jgi:hypothetical protein